MAPPTYPNTPPIYYYHAHKPLSRPHVNSHAHTSLPDRHAHCSTHTLLPRPHTTSPPTCPLLHPHIHCPAHMDHRLHTLFPATVIPLHVLLTQKQFSRLFARPLIVLIFPPAVGKLSAFHHAILPVFAAGCLHSGKEIERICFPKLRFEERLQASVRSLTRFISRNELPPPPHPPRISGGAAPEEAQHFVSTGPDHPCARFSS